MKGFKMTFIRAWNKSAILIAPLMTNNNKWSKWSKDMKLNLRWNATLTKTSKALERRRLHSELNQVPTDIGIHFTHTKETESWMWVSLEILLVCCSRLFLCSSFSTLRNQSSMETSTSSTTTTSSGRDYTSSSLRTDPCSQIKQSPDSHDKYNSI